MSKQFKAKEFVIDYDDIYKNDKLDREPHVKNVSNLLQNSSSPITFSINAPWGHGKTVFLDMLDLELLKSGCMTIIFSAWETDFVEEPLLAFLGEMNTALEELSGENFEKNKALKTVTKTGYHILKRVAPIGVKLATGGILDMDKAFEGEAEKMAETLSTDLIKHYEQDKDHIKKFKGNIEKVLKNEKGETQKLYILIDELDRCRPTYAIELLERIKHLFDIEGLVFVLAMDRKQLSHSVKAVYGNEFESLGYLRRFIDIEFSLDQPDKSKFINNLLDEHSFKNFFTARLERQYNRQRDEEYLSDAVILMSKNLNLSLRDIEQLVAKLHVISLSTNEQSNFYSALYVYLLIISEKYSDIYNEFIIEGTSPKPIIDLLHKSIPDYLNYSLCALIEAHLIRSKYNEYLNDDQHQASVKIISVYQKETEIPPVSDKNKMQIFNYKSKVVSLVTGRHRDNMQSIDLDLIIKKINFVESFTFS